MTASNKDLIRVNNTVHDNTPARVPEKALDDLYIDAYLECPTNKTAALQLAMERGGYLGKVHRQRANELHTRLKHKISKLLDERMLEGAAMGYSVLFQLATTADNEGVQAAAAVKLIEYAGKNKPQETTDRPQRDDIKEAIEQTKARIYAITGKQTK